MADFKQRHGAGKLLFARRIYKHARQSSSYEWLEAAAILIIFLGTAALSVLIVNFFLPI